MLTPPFLLRPLQLRPTRCPGELSHHPGTAFSASPRRKIYVGQAEARWAGHWPCDITIQVGGELAV